MIYNDTEMSDPSPIGKHCMITLHDIQNTEALKYINVVEEKMDIIARECNLNVVGKSGHQFQPWGVTYVHVLAESHMSIHTYPERSAAYMDIFCCSPTFSPDLACSVIQKVLGPCTVNCKTFIR